MICAIHLLCHAMITLFTPSVFSSLVLGLLHDDMPILDESIPPKGNPMAMVDDDAPPTWFHQDEVDHDLVFNTSPTTHERCSQGNIGDGASLVPLVDYLTNDCLHDVDPPISILHASATSPCDDLPIYDELMIAMWSLLVVMPCYIGFLMIIL